MPAIGNNSFFDVLELWQAAYSGDNPKLQELLTDPILRDKINYKMKSQGNHTALFFACYGAANAETIRLLIKAGADPFLRDDTGHIPLHLAANTQDPELIAALLEVQKMKDFKLDPATNGQTPFHTLFLPGLGVSSAVKSNNADLTKCLPLFLEVGNDPLGSLRKKDNNGISPIMLVKHYGLQAAFQPYVPPKTFGLLLKMISIPDNIEELLKSDVRVPESFKVNQDIVLVDAYANEDAIQTRSFNKHHH